MSELITDEKFTDGQRNIAASNMNGIVGRARVQPDIIANKPSSATMNIADMLLVLKTDNTLAQTRFDTITNSVASTLPVADSTKNGMLRQLSGRTTDYVGGDNNCHPLPVIPGPSVTTPSMNGVAAVGTGTTYARNDHVHPSDTSRLSTAGGNISGNLGVSGSFSANSIATNGFSTAGTVSAGAVNASSSISSSGSISANGAISGASLGVSGTVTCGNGGIAFTDVGNGFTYKIRWDGTNLFIYVGATPIKLALG